MTDDQEAEGYHNVNAFIFVDDADRLLRFLRTALGAVETERIVGPNGRIGHAEARIGDSIVMLNGASPTFPARPRALYLFVDDVDDAYRRSLAAGATSLRKPTDQFYGNREAGVVDTFGNIWWLATPIEDVAADEIRAAGRRCPAARLAGRSSQAKPG